MAEKQAVFTLKVDTGNSVQDVQNFDHAVQSLNKDLKQTQATASQQTGLDGFESKLQELDQKLKAGGLSMREMNKLMKEYQTVALQAGSASPIGDRATQSAAALKDQIVDLDTRVRLLSSDTIKLDTALAGVETGAAAFQGVTSAVALTGVESEALVQTMVKLQAAQGLVNSVNIIAQKLNKDAILGIQIRSALQKAQNFILYGSAAAVTAESTATKAAAGAKVAMTAATTGTNVALKIIQRSIDCHRDRSLAIVGLGLLIANFDKIVKFMKPVIDGFKAIGDAIGLTNFAEEEAHNKTVSRIQSEIKAREDLAKVREDQFNSSQKQYDRELELLDAQGKDTKKLTKLKIEESIKYQKEKLKELQIEINSSRETAERLKRLGSQQDQRYIRFQEITKERIELIESIKDAENSLAVNEAKNNEESEDAQKERNKKAADDAKARAKERADNNKNLIKQIEDAQIEAIQNEDIRARAKLLKDAERSTKEIDKLKADEEKKATLKKLIDEKLQRDLQALDDAALKKQQEAEKTALDFKIKQERELLKMIEDLSEQNFQLTLSDQERELLAIQDKYFTIETLAAGNSEALKEIEIAKLNEFNNVNLKFQEERDRQNKEQAEKEKKREQDILEFKLNSVTETFKLISTITEMFGKKGEKAARRAFMIQKASSIAQATIETYKGANAIFASAAANPSSILFPAQPFIAAGLAVAAGVANIAKISSQKFEGGGAPSASSDTGSIPSLTGASASSFTANTNTQTTDLTTLGQGSQQGTSMSQVVVLESDITGTQNKVRLQEAKTSF
jgi:hypothetical protein